MMFEQGSKLSKSLPYEDKPGVFMQDNVSEMRESRDEEIPEKLFMT